MALLHHHHAAVRRDRVILAASLGALVALAWTSLLIWERSPYAAYLGHAGDRGPLPLEAILFSLGWLLMIIAMMLPSSIPLVLTFRALVARRRRPGTLVGLLLVGYLIVWTGFGLAAWLGDRVVHLVVEATPALAAHPEFILAATLLAAGLWQFSPLRDRCLDECRSPLGFVMNRWRGVAERREALAMGLAHGAFCVGCCWSLMLVMFGVGVSSVTLMLALGAVTAIEKNLPWGRRMTRPLGVGLIVAAVAAVSW
jgi:predicted metal-binding membrane protein